MTQQSSITDGGGTDNRALVTKYGQLVVSPIDYSIPIAKTLALTDTAYNFITPISGKRIVITEMLLYANREVGVNDATVEIYEADSVDSTTVSKAIITTEMLKQSSRDLISLNMIVSEGKWVNAKTDDATIFITIMYYYIPVED